MASEPASSLYPSRPIRPLPKRRLRERLSPVVADSIQYPPLPQTAAPLFQYPYPLMEEPGDSASAPRREVRSYPEQRQPRSNGVGARNEDDSAALKNSAGIRSDPQHASHVARPKTENGRYSAPLPLPSTASSPEGYDLFENTNNKKRKIPTAGDSVPNGVHHLDDTTAGTGAHAAGSHPADGRDEASDHPSTAHNGSGSLNSSAQNVPGPGRGRYGRPRSGRNPLRPLYDATNSWAGRMSRPRSGQWANGSSESTGIISTAIANAEKLPPHQGQENISLLHQQSATKRSPASAQFTFTCDSQVPGSLAWPGADRRAGVPAHQQGAAGQGRENWSHAPQVGHSPSALPHPADAASRGGPPGGPIQPPAVPPKPRRTPEERYLAAARARRQQTQAYNKRHPPKDEDVWICHFCEYEAIFGTPPKALVRQYEIKERKQRRLEAQRRAQWERMKKGKHKGKKSGKAPAKNNGNVAGGGAGAAAVAGPAAHGGMHHPHAPAGAGPGGSVGPGEHHQDNHGVDGETYYDDEYYEDEEYDAEEPGVDSPGPPQQEGHANGLTSGYVDEGHGMEGRIGEADGGT